MMVWERLFRRPSKEDEPEDLLRITKVIGPLIERVSEEMFSSNREELLGNETSYVVPAVWGAKKDGELTTAQREMHGKFAPVLEKILQSLELRDVSGAQKFAFGYLIRGYVISKITYMIEMAKKGGSDKGVYSALLKQIEPLGEA